MTYQYHATCQCGYKSEILMVNTCICPNCCDLFDVPRLPFRYELSPCLKCNSPMFENDMLLKILGKGWLVTDKPSALTCPKCKNSKLQFHLDAHLSMMRGINFPVIGDRIDCCVKRNGKLDILWFALDASATIHHNIPDNLKPGQRIATRVTSIVIEKPTDTVKSMFYHQVVTRLTLEYIKTLSKNYRW